MTFEEWKEKHSDLIESVAITFFNYERGVDTKTCYDELEYLLKRAFNAGKNANVSTKWHVLRKNPDDLPPRKGLETYSDRVITDKGYSVYNFRKCRWYVDDPDCGCMVHTEVVAWSEIPKFEEVEGE